LICEKIGTIIIKKCKYANF